MSIILASRESKERVQHLLTQLLQAVIFPHITAEQQSQVMEQLAWMKTQKGEMVVGSKFGTTPETETIHISFDIRFGKEPNAKSN